MKKVLTFLYKHYFLIGLSVILCAAFLSRILFLTSIPNVIHTDEAALGYNAWSIVHFGVDRYLNEMPVYPQNFNGGQSPLYTYLVSLLILTIGHGNISLFIERLPSVIFNMLGIIFIIKIIHLIFKNKILTLVSAFFAAFLPYLLMQARIGLDCNLMYSCCAIAIYLTLKYVNTQKKSDLCLCGIAFGLVMYSYALSYIFVPVCLCLFALYLLFVKKINISKTILWAVCICVTCLPILLFIASLLFELEPFNFLFFHIYSTSTGRMTDLSLDNYGFKLLSCIWTTLTHDGLIDNSISKYGTVFYTSIPFIAVGFIISIYQFLISLKKRCFHYSALFFLYFMAGLFTMGFVDTYIHRTNFFYVTYLYFLILGIYSVYHFLQSYRKPFLIVLSGGYLLWTLSFLSCYFFSYKLLLNASLYFRPYFYTPPDGAVLFVNDELYPETFYIDSEHDEILLFFYPISPYEWGDLRHDDEDGFGHYKFKIDSLTPISADNAYLVSKENVDFISLIDNYYIPHETLEYEYYYLFYFTEQQ